MRKILNRIVIVFCFVIAIPQLQAQRAHAGSEGVWLLMDISSGVKSNYTIWRKSVRGEYEKVGKLLPPKSEAELDARLFDLEAWNLNMPARLNSSQIKRLWRVLQKNAPFDSFVAYSNNYPMLYAAGLAWYDLDAKSGEFSYKIVKTDAAGREMASKETETVKVPGTGPDVTFLLMEMRNTESTNTLDYEILNVRNMTHILVYRSYYQRTGYEKINPDVFFTKTKDGYRMTVSDGTAADRVPYAYYLIPVDAAGNAGNKSVDVKMYSNAVNTIPPSVTKFSTNSENAKKAIRLHWRLADASQVVSIDIYKSMEYDGKYFKIASVTPHDTDYYDYQVDAVASYYYTIVLNGMYETSPASPRVSGMLEGVNENFLAPQQVYAEIDEKGPKISWSRAETDTRGYFLWRGIGSVLDLKKVRQILSDSAQNFFIDTLPEVLEDTRVFYALTDVNTSYKEGPLSEVATCIARSSNSFPPPDSIYIYPMNERKIRIIWKPMGLTFGRVHGYNIYRYYTDEQGKEAEGSLQKLNATTLGYELNQYVDSNMAVGRRWVYFVRCVGEVDEEISKKSPEVVFTRQITSYSMVSQLLGFAEEGSVKLTWNNPIGDVMTGIEVWRSESGKEPKLLKQLGVSVENYVDAELKKGSTYFYYLQCIYGKEKSPFTDGIGVAVR